MDAIDRTPPDPPTATTNGDGLPQLSATRLLAVLLSFGVAWVLVQAALGLSEEPDGLAAQTEERMGDSGVDHPVTAVLLNFRAYDTFLEVAVLALAVLGVLTVRRQRDLWPARFAPPSRLHNDVVMVWLLPLLVPMLVLAGGYLLWRGASAPGGAFQAAALLAAAGVIMRMAGHPSVALLRNGRFRQALLVGLLAFLLVALGTMLFNDNLLQLPRSGTNLVILAIEAAVTISIAVTLVALFIGAEPQSNEESAPHERDQS